MRPGAEGEEVGDAGDVVDVPVGEEGVADGTVLGGEGVAEVGPPGWVALACVD